MSDDLDRLLRWEESGALWQVLGPVGETVTVSLRTCDGGEEMDRLISSADDVLRLCRSRRRSAP
ncbi:hypothetical protein [Gordonia sp. VNK21]|uniref:hypothetical protein n=1 Tax=Gordonia sp. VNK21 TaxID=3382483 RepID=UPI0038D472E0